MRSPGRPPGEGPSIQTSIKLVGKEIDQAAQDKGKRIDKSPTRSTVNCLVLIFKWPVALTVSRLNTTMSALLPAKSMKTYDRYHGNTSSRLRFAMINPSIFVQVCVLIYEASPPGPRMAEMESLIQLSPAIAFPPRRQARMRSLKPSIAMENN